MSTAFIVTTEEAAELFKVTEKTVNLWIREGMPVVKRGARGGKKMSRIDLRDAISWFVNYDALDAEKTRLTREQADKQALDNAVRRGELGELSQWRSEIESLFGQVRAALLAVPTKEAPQLDGNVNQRKERLERVVREILSRFATYQPGAPAGSDQARDRGRGAGVQPAAQADGFGVGRQKSNTVRRNKRRAR